MINLSNFNIDIVINMSYMIFNCSSLKVLNIFNFKPNDKVNIQKMFKECSSLKTFICADERMLNEYKNKIFFW